MAPNVASARSERRAQERAHAQLARELRGVPATERSEWTRVHRYRDGTILYRRGSTLRLVSADGELLRLADLDLQAGFGSTDPVRAMRQIEARAVALGTPRPLSPPNSSGREAARQRGAGAALAERERRRREAEDARARASQRLQEHPEEEDESDPPRVYGRTWTAPPERTRQPNLGRRDPFRRDRTPLAAPRLDRELAREVAASPREPDQVLQDLAREVAASRDPNASRRWWRR